MKTRSLGRNSVESRRRRAIIQDTLRRMPVNQPVFGSGSPGGFPPNRLPNNAAIVLPSGVPAAQLTSYVPGPPGNPGAPGAPGAAGAQGSAGVGVPGFDGKKGKDSIIPGPPGPAGSGATGATGAKGDTMLALDGKPGRDWMPFVTIVSLPAGNGRKSTEPFDLLWGSPRVIPREPLIVPGAKGDTGVAGGQGVAGNQGPAIIGLEWGRIIRVEPLFVPPKKYSGPSGFLLTGSGNECEPSFKSLISARLTADNAAIAAAVPTSVVAVTGLTQNVGLNEEWDIEWILELANSIAADVFVFNILTSAGTLGGRYVVEGTSGVPNTGAGVVKRWSMPAGTITVANANAPGATGTIGLALAINIRARIKLTVAGGTVSVGVRAGTNAALSSGTATVKSTSQMIANRIA